MKTLRLLLVALLFAGTASAQHHTRKARSGDYAPTVYLISAHQIDTLYNTPNAALQAALRNQQTVANAIEDYIVTQRQGNRQAVKPQFIFATRNNKFSFSIGGFVTLRTAYDFEGSVSGGLDFVPYNIPVPGTFDTKQRLSMDATTSRINLKAITNTRALGRVVIFMDMDFRGGGESSYTARLRTAYVTFKGLTIGRDVTTFCDLQAAPATIDFQGPNAYNFNFTPMIRYEVPFAHHHMTFGVAAELPGVSGTYDEHFASMPQRMPDFPMYLQYAWGAKRDSHIRLSGVVRNMYMRNLRTDKDTSLLGWGAQMSGTIKFCRWFQLFMNGVYGEGITPYIQDLTGSGLDFTPNPANAEQIQTMPMWGYQAAGQFNLSPRLFLSGGYSSVYVEQKHGAYSTDEYKQGKYIFGNIFYSLTPRCQIAAEYLYGTRQNMDKVENHANRVNVMLQYNF
ncbi:MAG: DcaP family trimeric outer membrane transporter [Alistipes sp.]